MAKTSASKSAYSAGAREERKAMRSYLRRQMAMVTGNHEAGHLYIPAQKVLDWVLDRQKRYDRKKGGL